MYDNMELRQRPIPSWKALEWLAKDYGLSVKEEETYDKVYLQNSSDWQQDPPILVVTNHDFCPCKRRYKWDLRATIDSVKYNWPKIHGKFDSSTSCAKAYRLFHAKHVIHTYLVCFRTTVF